MAGTFSSKNGSGSSSDCVGCVAGTYASSTGATVCTECEDGKYADTSNTVNCEQCGITPICNPSEYLIDCSTTAAARCSRCNDLDKPSDSSWLWSGSSQYSCVWGCDQGFFRSELNLCEACKTTSSCAYNQYVTNCNATSDGVCFNCFNKPLFSYYTAVSNLVGQSFCAWSCNDGYRKNSIFSTCEACAEGTYAVNSPGACIPCQTGKYASATSASVCLDCSSGTYNPSLGASACKICSLCPDNGYYKSDCGKTSPGECEQCTNNIK
jgi:hypothetical protein